jgi:hypothetical protein
VELADDAESVTESVPGDNFPGGFVYGFGVEVREIGGGGFVRGSEESARVSPESTTSGETFRYCLLASLV